MMMSWRNLLTGLSLVTAVGAGYLAIQADRKLDGVLSQIEKLQEPGYLLEQTGSVFDELVQKGVEDYFIAQKQSVIRQKYQAYQSAPSDDGESGKRIYGDPKARFTLVTYSDTECPFCKKFHGTPKHVVDTNPNINWEFKHMPLSMHNPVAAIQGLTAECIGKAKGSRAFYVFLQDVFEETKGNGSGVPNLFNTVRGVGVDPDGIATCLNDESERKNYLKTIAEAQSLGITSTPVTHVVDNQTGKSIVINGMEAAEAYVNATRELEHTDKLSSR